MRPSGAHPDVLTVQDAMKQVLDVFELVSMNEASDGVVWNLRAASTNSPFTAEGEAVSLTPDVDVTVVARAQRMTLGRNLRAISEGAIPDEWRYGESASIAKRLLQRNLNGVGATDIVWDEQNPPITITPSVAERAVKVLDAQPEAEGLLPSDLSRQEYGSIEGRLLYVGTNYNYPAVKVEERKSGAMLWCRVDEALRDEIARRANFVDVWEHRRVIVTGHIRYDSSGAVTRVTANFIELVTPRDMTLRDIHDPDFTDGISTSEYINRLRDGDFGR